MGDGVHKPVDQFQSVDVFKIERYAALISPETQRLFDWWTASPSPVQLDRFDPAEHPQLLPHLYLVRHVGKGVWRISLQGEEIKLLIGRNNTGLILDPQSDHPRLRWLAAHYNAIASERIARRCHGTLVYYDRDYRWIEAVDLPLADRTGAICAILGCMAAVPKPETDPPSKSGDLGPRFD